MRVRSEKSGRGGRVRAIVDVADRKNKIVGNYSDAQILM